MGSVTHPSHAGNRWQRGHSALLGKYSSVSARGRALKHSFRASFGSHLPWLRGVLGTVFSACQWEQHGAALPRRERVEPGSLGSRRSWAGQADKRKAVIRSHKQYVGLLQPVEMMRKIPLAYNWWKTCSFYLGSCRQAPRLNFASSG